MKLVINIIVSALFIGGVMTSKAQETDPLQYPVTVHWEKVSIEQALFDIGHQSKTTLSYNAQQFPVDSLITAQFEKQPLTDVVTYLLGKEVELQAKGRHIIIRKVMQQQPDRVACTITGNVYDFHSKTPLEGVTVYILGTKKSVTQTNGSGAYALNAITEKNFIEITFNTPNYQSEVVIMEPDDQININVGLKMNHIDKMASRPSEPIVQIEPKHQLDNVGLVNLMVSEEQKRITDDLLEFLEDRSWQISFLPMLGTNGPVSGITTNKVSVNILAGYARGLTGIEVGGLLNIIREDVKGIQLSGFGNVVGGKVIGGQAAGFLNYNLGSVYGLQYSGFSNVVLDTVIGLQAAGFNNLTTDYYQGIQLAGFSNVVADTMSGFQLSGFHNYAKTIDGGQFSGFSNMTKGKVVGIQGTGFANLAIGDVNGLQASGFSNITSGTMEGMQLTGMFNYAQKVKGIQLVGFSNIATDTMSGFQLAGFHNYAKMVDGAQFSGFSNMAMGNVVGIQGTGFANLATGDVSGMQASGFANVTSGNVEGVQVTSMFNHAKNVRGVQLGLINVADSIQGVPIGLINIIKSGYIRTELAHSELNGIDVSFKSGIRPFYSIIRASYTHNPRYSRWSTGLGAGTSWNLVKDRISTDFNLTANSYYFDTSDPQYFNLHTKLEGNLAVRLFWKLELFGGVSANNYISRQAMTPTASNFLPPTDRTVVDQVFVDNWWGYQFGIRF